MKKRRTEIWLILLFTIMIIMIRNISYKSFIDYENTILSQQSAHLLTIAKSTAQSLELYIDEKLKESSNLAENLNILSKTNTLSNEIIANEFGLFHNSQKKEISEIMYIDKNKNTAIVYPAKRTALEDKNFDENFKRVSAMKLPYIGKPWQDGNGKFYIYIYQPLLINNNLEGVILVKIDLEKVYNKLVKPIKAGEQGYAMVKDSTGLILMHPVKEQIGYSVIKSRKERYPDLDLSDVEKLVKLQLKGEPGTYIYYSYWWPQEKLKRVKKLNGFAPAFIGDEFWVIAVVMSYDEISAPIKNYFYASLLVSFIIILVFAWALSLIIRMMKNKEAHQMESAYLHELNENTNMLRKKETELHHKRKMETIGTLTGGIAHEFNNILTPIMGYSEMILRDLDPESEMHEDVKVIYDSSKRSQEIIDQILIYSDNRSDVNYEVLSLNKILNDIKKVILSLVPKDVELKFDIEDSKNIIIGNETQFHQVIINLVKNAVNAMQNSEEKKLTISLNRIERKNNKIFSRISIEDTGCGMSEETQEKIFNPFYTEKLSKDSTGLGLSVAVGIIEKQDGRIMVNSELGIGSRFEVFVPQASTGEVSGTKKQEKNEQIELRGTEKLLILDNEQFIAKMLKKGMNSLGYKTKSFTNGYDILENFDTLSSEGYEILITDLTMPEISGIELSKLLRIKNENIKIILMTAHPEEPLDSYIKNGIINEYLLKPVSATEISACVRKLVEE